MRFFKILLNNLYLNLKPQTNETVDYPTQTLTIEELQKNYSHINWLDFINWNLKNIHHINKSQIIRIGSAVYFQQLESTLQNTPKRTIANYFAWQSVVFASKFLNDALYERYQQFLASTNDVYKMKSRYSECPLQAKELYV